MRSIFLEFCGRNFGKRRKVRIFKFIVFSIKVFLGGELCLDYNFIFGVFWVFLVEFEGYSFLGIENR